MIINMRCFIKKGRKQYNKGHLYLVKKPDFFIAYYLGLIHKLIILFLPGLHTLCIACEGNLYVK